jgi:hypothetical protein
MRVAIVTRLNAFDEAVTTEAEDLAGPPGLFTDPVDLDAAIFVTAVAAHRVAVVAGLARLEDAVPADRSDDARIGRACIGRARAGRTRSARARTQGTWPDTRARARGGRRGKRDE